MQLLASQRGRPQSAEGTAVSLIVHGVIFAGILLTGRVVDDVVHGTDLPARPIQFIATNPAPARPATTSKPKPRPAVQPTATEPTVPPTITEPVINDVTPVAVTDVSTSDVPATDAPAGTGDGAGTTGTEVGTASPFSAGAFAEHAVDQPAAIRAYSPLPRYPERLRPTGMAGVVRVRFVVGTDGRVEMNTVQILEATHVAFADALRDALPRMRFSPAKVGRRAVRQLVEIPIAFRVER